MLYYSVAHYYDVSSQRKKNKYTNIKNHITQFKEIENTEKAFVIVTAVDAPITDNKYYNHVKKDLYALCKQYLPDHNVYIIVKFNWGGTIAALWATYKFLMANNKEGFVAHFEEDFGPKNKHWYEEASKQLTDDIIYVGESNIGRIKYRNDDNRLSHPIYYNQPRLGAPEVWTDGGFYFSTVKKLKIIEDKIGIFHKGDPNKKYVNLLDGISLGEVGFPTLIYHQKLKFSVLNRKDFFVNEWND